MPPWFADYPKGIFTNERGLTDQQIETILAWVNAGAPAGDKAKGPAPVQFADVRERRLFPRQARLDRQDAALRPDR